jgi:hypothetical protein
MAGFNFLGSPQYTGGGLRMNQQSPYDDGVGLRAQTPMMTQGNGMTMASMPQSFGQMPTGGQMNAQGLMMASKLLDASQPQQAPMVQNNIPMGRNMTYEDIMKMYGIQGLMG